MPLSGEKGNRIGVRMDANVVRSQLRYRPILRFFKRKSCEKWIAEMCDFGGTCGKNWGAAERGKGEADRRPYGCECSALPTALRARC